MCLCRCVVRHPQAVTPVARQTLAAPAFCALNSSGLGRHGAALIFAFRGSLTSDDAILDAAGHLYVRNAPAATATTAATASAADADDDQGSGGGGTGSTAAPAHARVHGGYWDAWNASGAAAIVRALMARPEYSNASTYFTGHSTGGALALLAAHDTCVRARAASGGDDGVVGAGDDGGSDGGDDDEINLSGDATSATPQVHLFTQGKPFVGGAELAASMAVLVTEGERPGGCLRTVRRHVLRTDAGAVDPVTIGLTPESRAMMAMSSSNISWEHETPGQTLPCVTGIAAQPSAGGTILSCHAVRLYADQLHELAEEAAAVMSRCAGDSFEKGPRARVHTVVLTRQPRARAHARRTHTPRPCTHALSPHHSRCRAPHRCEARELFEAPLAGLNLCGGMLSSLKSERWPGHGEGGEAPQYDAYCNEQDAVADVLRHGPGGFVVALLCVIVQVLLMHILLVSLLGYITGRERWWAGPYMTGFLGFGDGAAMASGLEVVLGKGGVHSVCKDLYFCDEHGLRNLAPPVRIPQELAREGFRGRSDDPATRPPSAAVFVPDTPMATAARRRSSAAAASSSSALSASERRASLNMPRAMLRASVVAPAANDRDLDPSLIHFEARPEHSMTHEKLKDHYMTIMMQAARR